MSLYKTYKTEESIETEGFDLIVADGDDYQVVFRLARAGGRNTKYENRVESLTKGMERALRNRTLSKDKMTEIMCQALADTVILGWDNVMDEDNSPVPFSPAAAKKILMELPDLRDVILEEAQKIGNFQAQAVEEDLGNSESTSAGL